MPIACLSGIDEKVEHIVCECPAYGGERNILMKNIVEFVAASTWRRECGDNEGLFKLMVRISGKSTKYSVECTKICLLNVWDKRKRSEGRSNGPFQISYYFEYYKRRTKRVLQFTY